jgi:hypothetical protein
MVPTTGAAAIMGVVSGGILGGALHAIAGKSILCLSKILQYTIDYMKY